MKFADWVPIIVAAITFASVIAGNALSGGRARQQLEALKVVRESLAATNDHTVRGLLTEAERHLAGRIELRYRPVSKRVVGAVLVLSMSAVAAAGLLLASPLFASTIGPTLVAAVVGGIAALITIAALLVTRTVAERANEAATDAQLARLNSRIRALLDDQDEE